MEELEGEVPTAPLYVWVGLILMACVSFWAQATVTEDRFVPSLNVIAEYYNIPDDIAGATLMAAGASSPELFSSLVSLFITHSALGLGTIIGSEVFNQLIICAGAVFASKSGQLELDPIIVTREVGFYILAIILFYVALQDRRPADDDEIGEDHIYISFRGASLMFSGYILYVIVCANMKRIVSCIKPEEDKDDKKLLTDGVKTYGSTDDTVTRHKNILVPRMPYMLKHEPSSNFLTSDDKTDLQISTSNLNTEEELHTTPTGLARVSSKDDNEDGRSGLMLKVRRFSDGASLREFKFRIHKDKPTDEHELYDLEMNEYKNQLSCFMWQRSFFYTKARASQNGWHLRWFTFTTDSIFSVPNRANFEKYQVGYPKFTKIEVDEDRLLIRIPQEHEIEGTRDFIWMAPSKKTLLAVVKKIEGIMVECENKGLNTGIVPDDDFPIEEHDGHAESLIEFPDLIDDGYIVMFFFLFLYPIRVMFHFTIPDVRVTDSKGNPTATLRMAFLAVLACLVWLIILSYAMVSSLEHLAELMDIPTSVVGVTVSAAGTSLPNYVASKVAAQKGFGNMAVSNAFGSNSFNIMVGLGLPWLLYISLSNDFKPYHGLRDEGITEMVETLSIVLALFLVLTIPSGFVVKKWHGFLYIFVYIAYILNAVLQVYL